MRNKYKYAGMQNTIIIICFFCLAGMSELACKWPGGEGKCISGDCMNGKGTYQYPFGGTYEGQWKDGKFHGQGTYTIPYYGKYTGEYREGKRDGQGTQIFREGGHYTGQWKDDKYEGQGELTDGAGKKFVGEFREGNFMGGQR